MPPNLQPISQLSAKILPPTGSHSEVLTSLAFGVYTSNSFISGCVDAVSYVYQKLGGNILDIELETSNIYNAYEDAVLTYSKIINTHQAKNILLSALGASTGSFNQDGELTSGQSISLKYPNFSLGYARTMAEGFANEGGFGGTLPIYSASFSVTPGVQDYNLQAIIQSSTEYSGVVGDKRIIIRDIFYRTPQSMWRFFGYYGQFNVIGAWGAYGQYANDSTFFLAPVFQTKLQAAAFEDALWTRTSHYSYEIINNNIRIYPIPTSGSPAKMWFRFSIKQDPWSLSGSNGSSTIDGVNNINTLPFANIPYENINSMGKHFIREYCLANCMETLSFVRGKYGNIPLPKNQVTLNAGDLSTKAGKMKDDLIKMLMDDLEQLKYSELTKQRKEMADNAQDLLSKIPLPIYLR